MQPLKTFIIYSSKDRAFREELESHLQILIDDKLIELWSDKQILPGEAWDAVIKQKLHESELILLLVSIDLYGSDYIRNEEFKIALDRLQTGKAIVVPIIVRACLWNRIPVIKDLQVLPDGGHAVGDEEVWKSRDKAWHHVAARLVEMIEKKFNPAAIIQHAEPAKTTKSAPVQHAPKPVYTLIKNPVSKRIPLESGVYPGYIMHPEKPAMYLFKYRETIDYGQHYDLVYFDLTKRKTVTLANVGTDNYNLEFLDGILYSTASVKEYETHRILAFKDTQQVATPFDQKIIKYFMLLNGKLVCQFNNQYSYLDEFGKQRKIDFLNVYNIPFIHKTRNLIIVSNFNKQIKSKYQNEWEHPQDYFLLEYDDDMNLVEQRPLFSETNTIKYEGFTEWDANRVLFNQVSDENGDGVITYDEKDNKQLLVLNLETLEVETLVSKKFTLRCTYGLTDHLVLLIDESQEDVLHTGMVYDLNTQKLSRCFELTGSCLQFNLNEDRTKLLYKKILPDPKKGTFYDWENESEIYEMTFAEFIAPT